MLQRVGHLDRDVDRPGEVEWPLLADEIAEVLLKICDTPSLMFQKRLGSRAVWQERYNAEKNFEAFAELLIAIRKN